ncbi:branched-chain amino acid ABC transporter permease [Terrarubrum flagellatum]|uniref:branched-chain amino acid ABC transporter permease n=1 Tax=Terrirubrum flagellatum TaxID=2895980 RepID=UPI0031456371
MRFSHLIIIGVLAFAAGILVSVLLSGPDNADEAQSRLCRAMLPALAPDDSAVTVTRVGRGPSAASVRVDYVANETSGRQRARFVVCAFAEEGLGARKTDLVSVITERGRMSDASLFFLRRYWLDQPEAALRIPPPPTRKPLLGRTSKRAAYAIQQAVAGLPLTAVTGLLATAYALVYGLVGRIILTFGEFAALGAAGVTLGVALAQAGGVADTLALLAIGLAFAAWVTASWGAAAAKLVLAPVVRQSGQHVLIATVGLALAISEGIRLTQGYNTRWMSPVWNEPISLADAPDFAATTTPITLIVSAAAILSSVALVLFMRRSRYGRAWRAAADDAVAASMCGVDVQRTVMTACALACCVAGLSGFLLTLHIGGMGFGGGGVFGLKALVGAIVGGVGSVGGAMLGGLAVGALEALWSSTMPIEWRDVAVFSLLSVVLIFRPGGFFGEGGTKDRPQGRAL